MSSIFSQSLGALALAVLSSFAIHARAAQPLSEPSPGETEYKRSGWLNRIGADRAHALGITGRHVRIAILDTGLAADHAEFGDTGRILRGIDVISGGSNVTDRNGHGTYVAGLLGAGRNARGMLGVAHDATILPVKVLPDTGAGAVSLLDRGLRQVIGKARIANMSVSAGSKYEPGALQEAVRAGLLVVVAAGNDAAAHPGWPARFAREDWAANQIIAVGAVDDANHLATFSNRAGDAAAWFLVAPGVALLAPDLHGGYATLSGTSMSAPLVSGAAALLMQAWPSLTAQQVATILLVTATDLGVPGIDPVYGRGLLNIDRALRPVGTLITTTHHGRSIALLDSAVQPSAATSRLWSLAAAGQLQVKGMDDFGRDFGLDLGASVARPEPVTLQQLFGKLNSRIDVAEQLLTNGTQLRAEYDRVPSHPGSTERRLAALSLRSTHQNGVVSTIGTGGTGGEDFGVGGLLVAHGLPVRDKATLAHPYLALAPGAYHLALSQQIGAFGFKAGVFASGRHAVLSAESVFPSVQVPQRTESGAVEISRAFARGALALSVSQTRETGGYLGSHSRGALSFGKAASTSAVQLAGAFLLAPQFALAGQLAYGITPGRNDNDSLISTVSTMRTQAFSVALVAADRLRRGDRMTVSLTQPMRTYAGQIVVEGLSAAGRQGHTSPPLVFSMVPKGRELRAELHYDAPVGPAASVGLALMLRRQADHLTVAGMERLLALRYAKSF